jgi:hypothetical protein
MPDVSQWSRCPIIHTLEIVRWTWVLLPLAIQYHHAWRNEHLPSSLAIANTRHVPNLAPDHIAFGMAKETSFNCSLQLLGRLACARVRSGLFKDAITVLRHCGPQSANISLPCPLLVASSSSSLPSMK